MLPPNDRLHVIYYGISTSSDEMPSQNPDRTDDAKATVADVERIVVSAETVVDALQYNAKRKPGAGNLAFFAIEPPAEGTVEPTVEYIAADPEDRGDVTSIRLRPERFLDRGTSAAEEFPTREQVEAELGEEATEDEIDQEHEKRASQWRAEVHRSLGDQIELTAGSAFSMAHINYN
jgi:hypothetical protein